MKKERDYKSRGMHIMVGMIVALSFVFISFEWSSTELLVSYPDYDSHESFVPFEQMPITRRAEEKHCAIPIPKVNLANLHVVEELLIDIEEPLEVEDLNIEPAVIDIVDLPEENTEMHAEPTFVTVEQMPRFPGGEEGLMRYLLKNISYPEAASAMYVSGRVYISFVIDRDGAVRNVKLERGVDPLLDNEAQRVVAMMPKWKPGMQNGKNVKVRMTIPVNFVLR